MQRDFFQSSDGAAIGNLGLSVKYFIVEMELFLLASLGVFCLLQ